MLAYFIAVFLSMGFALPVATGLAFALASAMGLM